MIEYVRHRLSKIEKNSPDAERILRDIYNELESKGYSHYEVYIFINSIIFENIQKIAIDYLKNKEKK
jgi:uncharacterized protein (UPF0297 family)